jgi:hypothetical protein
VVWIVGILEVSQVYLENVYLVVYFTRNVMRRWHGYLGYLKYPKYN